MKKLKYHISLQIALLAMLFVPQFALAAPQSSAHLNEANSVDFQLSYDSTTKRYSVYARSSSDSQTPHYLLGAQITIRVSHVEGDAAFTPMDIVGELAGSDWLVTSRVNAPVENPDSDYLSFTFEPSTDISQRAYMWSAGEEILLFTFVSSACTGTSSLITASDEFFQPVAAGGFNSTYTDPSNTMIVAAQGASYLNELTVGVYGQNEVSCQKETIEEITNNTQHIYLPIVVR